MTGTTVIYEQLQAIVEETQLPFVDIDAGRGDGSLLTYRASSDRDAMPAEPLFLTASLTKPVVATAVLQLAAQGRLALGQRIGDWLTEFRSSEFRRITVRHLLTHTSGFPDQLPNNAELRAAHVTLSDFRREACRSWHRVPSRDRFLLQQHGLSAARGNCPRNQWTADRAVS